MKIGFIGLGHMGSPMALNLQHKRFDLIGYDAFPDALEYFKQLGGNTCQHLEELQNIDVLITMVPSAKELFEVYDENGLLLPYLKPNTLTINCSTVGPLAAQKWHTLSSKFQLQSVDAPVSGGVSAAKAATLSFMIGGETDAIKKAKPILENMGNRLIETGGPATGQIAKICNNLILANTMIAVSEAFLLAESLGMNLEKLLQVIQASSGNSWVIEKYLPVPGLGKDTPANHDYQPGFSTKMMLKDLKLVLESGLNTGQNLPLSHKACELFEKLQSNLQTEMDFSYIYQYLKN